MPHLRDRYLSSELKQVLSWSKTVSLLGMRQVGKTTLLKNFARTYVTLDNQQVIDELNALNWTVVEYGDFPIALDECQKFPRLFDHIKMRVDQLGRPGQYLLTGSVRFLSKKQIKVRNIVEIIKKKINKNYNKIFYGKLNYRKNVVMKILKKDMLGKIIILKSNFKKDINQIVN